MIDKKKQETNYNVLTPIYKLLEDKVYDIIKDNLEEAQLKIHAITHRIKTEDSFHNKIRVKNYVNPEEDISDILGFRIITYVEDDVLIVSKIIRSLFSINDLQSVDKNLELGEDRMGYRSMHLICTLNEQRLEFPGYLKYKDLKFEIQVRTILQHTWAEIEHDKNYKFSIALPPELKRRMMLLSGTLELLDREFNSISNDIDEYVNFVKIKTNEGILDTLLDTISLSAYLQFKLAAVIKGKKVKPNFEGNDELILEELRTFGIITINDLDDIIPDDFVEIALKEDESTNYIGTLRNILIIHDVERYLKDSYRTAWQYFGETNKMFSHYKVDVYRLPGYNQWLRQNQED